MVKKQPAYVVDRTTYLEVIRNGDRCGALDGGEPDGDRVTRYACKIYDDRPRTCREFTLGSAHCLTARRRVGLVAVRRTRSSDTQRPDYAHRFARGRFA